MREVFFAAGFSAGAAISWVFVVYSPKRRVARGRHCVGWYHVRV